MYTVIYEDAGQYKTKQFSVEDLTSESLSVEKQRLKATIGHSKHKESDKPHTSPISWNVYVFFILN